MSIKDLLFFHYRYVISFKNFFLDNVNREVSYPRKTYFSGPASPWGVAGAAARVGASKHLDPLQQRIDALVGCQGETN